MKFMTRLIVALPLILLPSLVSAQSVDSLNYRFTISIADYLGVSGQLHEYDLSPDSLRVSYDCDFTNCRHKVIYRQAIEEAAAERFSQFVSGLRIDTLKNRYSNPGCDGLVRAVIVQRNGKQQQCILLERFHHPGIDALVKEINNLIEDKQYRIRR